MDEASARIPSRIVLQGSTSICLSERFRQLRQNSSRPNKMSGRHFLYDDYMEGASRGDDYARASYSSVRNEFGARSGQPSIRRRNLDMGLDEYASIRQSEGILSQSSGQARRFANAMGIPSSTRTQRVYDDLDYLPPAPARSRVLYRDAPIIQRVVGGRRPVYDSPREVVQIIERVRRPQPRVQVIRRKVPIHQRVVKKVIVKKTVRPGGINKRRSVGGTNAGGRVQRRGIQKKKVVGGGRPKKDQKPKLTASELDRELDEYMKSSKHPRVGV